MGLERRSSRAGSKVSTALEESLLPEFTEDAIALKFSTKYAEQLRYVAEHGSWYLYDGRVWKSDKTYFSYDRIRRIAREEIERAAGVQETRSLLRKMATAQFVAGVEKLARSDRRQALTPEAFDRDDLLLNTPGGVVDLRTGETRKHVPREYHSRITAVAPALPGTPFPHFQKFLNDITDGDLTLQKFMQREAGYSLTGTTREQCSFFHYGTGGNGKGVLLNTERAILGTYATVADMSAFTATKSERHPTDLASLWGARVVFAQESEQGSRWSEARFKAITGGDPIKARFMRQDFFEFIPKFKLVIAGNHRPQIRNLDEAMRRRFHLVPHTVTIPKENRDPDLPERLRKEWPAILRWMIDGCLEYQRVGLAPPAAVVEATAEYFESEDTIGRWLAERCRLGPQFTSTCRWLFLSWQQWSASNGEYTGSQRALTQKLKDRPDLDLDSSWRDPLSRDRGFKGIYAEVESPNMEPAE